MPDAFPIRNHCPIQNHCRNRTRTLSQRGLLGLLLLVLVSTSASGQSCILTRIDSPVLSAFDSSLDHENKWQFTFGWRYGYSFRHFRGSHEEPHRVEEGSQVVNNVNLADLTLRYSFSSQTSISIGVPYLMATRSAGLRGENGEVVRRYTRSNNRGLGDISVVGKHLLWDPAEHPRSNLSLGLGVKLPTGDNMQQQNRISIEDGEEVVTTSTADNSVQPGDGGFGVILEIGGYRVLNHSGSLALYGTGTYIISPEETSGVYFRDRPGEEEVSIADQYVARLGLQLGPQGWNGWSVGLGGRIEGIPVHDLIGGSSGRRRPGYMVSVEPSVTWSRGNHSVSLALPWAVERNRERSYSDIIRDVEGGDAAFPDYLVIAGWSVRF